MKCFKCKGEMRLGVTTFVADKDDCCIVVRRVPCMLAPAQSALDGVFCKRAEVVVGGSRMEFPLAEADAVCDRRLLEPSFAEGYARLLLSRLAVFEARAMRILTGEGEPCEEAWALLAALTGEPDGETVVRLNGELRMLERDGAFTGEGVVLARLYGGSDAAYCAVRALSALYAAFFKRGRPRCAVPMPQSYGDSLPPTVRECARRAMRLETHRKDLLRELSVLLRGSARERRIYATFAGRRPPSRISAEKLYELPLHAPQGLCAVVRDFGLFEP